MSDYQILSVPQVAGAVAPVTTGTTSAQSTALPEDGDYMVVVTALSFVLRGSNPTATTSCLPLAPNVPYRLRGMKAGEKLAFVLASGTGVAYICRTV